MVVKLILKLGMSLVLLKKQTFFYLIINKKILVNPWTSNYDHIFPYKFITYFIGKIPFKQR